MRRCGTRNPARSAELPLRVRSALPDPSKLRKLRSLRGIPLWDDWGKNVSLSPFLPNKRCGLVRNDCATSERVWTRIVCFDDQINVIDCRQKLDLAQLIFGSVVLLDHASDANLYYHAVHLSVRTSLSTLICAVYLWLDHRH